MKKKRTVNNFELKVQAEIMILGQLNVLLKISEIRYILKLIHSYGK